MLFSMINGNGRGYLAMDGGELVYYVQNVHWSNVQEYNSKLGVACRRTQGSTPLISVFWVKSKGD